MWYNRIVMRLLRSPLHGLISGNMLIVRYAGRTSGAAYSLPVNYVQDGTSFWVVSFRSRIWWRNLRGGAAVTLLVRQQEITAHGRVLETPAEVVEALPEFLKLAPAVARSFSIGLEGGPFPGELEAMAERTVLVQFVLDQPIWR